MASSINVKIAPLPRGNYSSSATYAKLDVVSYNGSSYMAIKAVPTGTVPTNTTYWQLLAEKPTIGEGSITTDMLADGAVTADKLDSSVSEVYAEVSGTYEDMVVGSAEQLLSTQYDTDSVPYAFRKSPYGDREFDEIVGGSIAWNQLAREIADTYYARLNCSASYSSGVATVTNSGTGAYGLYLRSTYRFSIIGHQYFVSATIKSDTAINNVGKVGLDGSNCPITASANVETTISTIQSATVANNAFVVYLQGNSATIKNAMCIDLTQMFGSSVADAIYAMETAHTGDGVAFFRSLFPKPYYAYNAGQLISVSGLSAHKMTGFNQWDEEWELGNLNPNDGTNLSASNRIRTKNYIPIIPNTQYYARAPILGTNAIGTVCYYDRNKNFISVAYPASNYTFTTPQDACYMRIGFYTLYGTTYKHDICINISGERNGEYEPYESHSYALDSSLTLRGVPKLVDNKMQFDGDIYQSDGTVQRRYAVITLNGTETWSGGNTYWYTQANAMKKVEDYKAIMFCLNHVVMTNNYRNDFVDGTITGYYDSGNTYPNQNWIYYKNSSFTSASDVKAYFTANPTTVVYELATPTTESASPYVSPQICNEYGTEEYISAEQNGVTMIVGHNTKYPQNLRKKIEGLPWNFSSLIAPTEVTNKATRNYTVGSYLIMNNTLYKVTSAIANGGTITVGSNVSATTIMQEILAL